MSSKITKSKKKKNEFENQRKPRFNINKPKMLSAYPEMNHPRDQKFYCVLALLMTFLNLVDRRWWGMKPYNIYVQVNRICALIGGYLLLVSQILYLYLNYKVMSSVTFEIMLCLIPISLLGTEMSVTSQTKAYKSLIKKFLSEIHLYSYRDGSLFVDKLILQIEKISRWTLYYIAFFIMLSSFYWTYSTTKFSILHREEAANKTVQLQTILYLLLPYDYEYNFINWVITHSIGCYVIICGCCFLSISYAVTHMYVYHFIGHVEIFKHKIKTLFVEDCSEREVHEKLKKLIEYHQFIVQSFKEIEKVFGPHVAVTYFYNLIADSYVLYKMMLGEKENKFLYGPLIFGYGGSLVLMSFALEEVVRRTVELPELIYCMPWEKMSIPNQKIVLVLLARVQQPLFFKAMWGLTAGVKPMMSIIKSTFSYYVMLKSTIE